MLFEKLGKKIENVSLSRNLIRTKLCDYGDLQNQLTNSKILSAPKISYTRY